MDNGRSHTTPKMELAVRIKAYEANNDILGNYRVRTICNWSSTYSLSGVFGQDSLEWTSPATEEKEEAEGEMPKIQGEIMSWWLLVTSFKR